MHFNEGAQSQRKLCDRRGRKGEDLWGRPCLRHENVKLYTLFKTEDPDCRNVPIWEIYGSTVTSWDARSSSGIKASNCHYLMKITLLNTFRMSDTRSRFVLTWNATNSSTTATWSRRMMTAASLTWNIMSTM